MPARARKSTPPVEIGGVEVTHEQIRSAIDVLTSASGIMVKQPLARAEHPLAAADYHAVAREQRELDGEPKAQTKPMFIRALERHLATGD